MNRILSAFKAFWATLMGAQSDSGQPVVDKEEKTPKETVKAEPPRSDRFEEGTIYSLILLQRDARFIDFIQESIDEYSDSQVGAAVRKIHADCKKVLAENFSIDSIFAGSEGERVTVEKGFETSMIRFLGNFSDERPGSGILRHKGWRVKDTHLPARSDVVDPNIIQPAELEIN